jgi:L-malate glycosyltransferase
MTHGQRIRICIVAPSPLLIGGQARQAQRLVTGLADEPSFHVSFIPHNPRLPGVLGWFQQIKYVRTIVTTLVYWSILLARLWCYDVIHIFSASYYSYLLSVVPAILLGKLYGKRVILNYRSGEAEDHLKEWPMTTVPVMKLADAIVVPSGYLVDIFYRFGLRAQAIFNVVELDHFRYRERSLPRPIFLTSRALEPLYNGACVLHAFRQIQNEYPDAKLTVAADGSERSRLIELVHKLRLKHVEFLGNVLPEKMPVLYDEADVYVMAPSLDNMPGTILECYASGLPVVTTQVGGIPYIVTDEQTGLFCRSNDAKGLADQALRLLREPELAARISRQGHELSRQYSWSCVRQQWRNVYQCMR